MPRTGISFEEVAAIADSLTAEGVTPSIKNVRERSGTGSPNTIQRHLAAWRETVPHSTVTVELPASILAAINQEIIRSRAEAKAELEAKLVLVQGEAAELAGLGEMLEANQEVLFEEIETLKTNRDMVRGKLQEQASEIDRLTREIERERYGAEQARIELAQIRNRIDIQADKIAEQSVIIDQLTTKYNAETAARNSAEKDAAVLTSKLESDHEKLTALLKEKEVLLSQLATERLAREEARSESVKCADKLVLKSALLEEQTSKIKEVYELYETERRGRIDAEIKLADQARKFKRHTPRSSGYRQPI